jgi:hypothetical protein
MLNKCPRCKSIWVCWNWLSDDKTEWHHECWNCAACWMTNKKIIWGIPYLVLKWFGNFFVEPGLFDKMLAEDMSKLDTWLDDEEEDWREPKKD